ncbi:hypothetical protein UVI_02034370 [Ustilaginoidea virens]|uniref:Uncharacterized protein n=1 Tax=Ustilaginoidea virens TaxID=1159556 RepID=A0A1B5KTS9_USTVR|nr:hypothetical protein UVI_02034370 [Ustilaginoidea virens]
MLFVIYARNDPRTPTAPAPGTALYFWGQNTTGEIFFVIPLRNTCANADHSDQLALDPTTYAFNLVPLIAWAELGRRDWLLIEPRRGATVTGILRIAIYFVFTLSGGKTSLFAATYDTAISITDASAQTAEDLSVLVAPAPDAA